jgi:hypothetical protein
VTLTSGATLSIVGPVKIVLNGKLHAGGASFRSPSRVPADLQIASSYTASGGVTLSAGAEAYLSVFAPGTGVTLNGGAPIYGGLLGKSLTISGKAVVHYDVQLATVWAVYFNNP